MNKTKQKKKMNPTVQNAIIAAISAVSVALITTLGTISTTTNELNDARKEASNLVKRVSMSVGTVIPSMLDTSQFAKLVGDEGPFDQEKSHWAPADGEKIIKLSKYGQLFRVERTPDLRAMFLRGLNSFDPTKPRKDEYRDPNPNRLAGEEQLHSFAPHEHEVVKRLEPSSNLRSI